MIRKMNNLLPEELTADDLVEFYQAWNLSLKDGPLRFGQAFIVTVMSNSVVWPELFYETDIKKCVDIIRNTVIMNTTD